MRPVLCDECEKKLNKLSYCRGVIAVIGLSGRVAHYTEDNGISKYEKSLGYEVCSKKCLLTYLRKNLK